MKEEKKKYEVVVAVGMFGGGGVDQRIFGWTGKPLGFNKKKTRTRSKKIGASVCSVDIIYSTPVIEGFLDN